MFSYGAPSKLRSAPINISAVRDDIRAQLDSLLDSIYGPTALVVDPAISSFLKLIVPEGDKYYKERHIMAVSEIGKYDPESPCDTVLYVTTLSMENCTNIANEIRGSVDSGESKKFYVTFLPRRSEYHERAFADRNLLGYISFLEWDMDIIPVDDDIMVMGLDHSFREVYVSSDYSSLFHTAKAIMKLQAIFGRIPSIYYKGNEAQFVVDSLFRFQHEEDAAVRLQESSPGPDKHEMPGGKGRVNVHSEISEMIILDRSVDLISPLMTPLTFEALLREVLGLNNGVLEVDASIIQDQKEATKTPVISVGKVDMYLNTDNELYTSLRDVGIGNAAKQLSDRARELALFRDEIRMNKDLEVSAIHAIVKSIPKHQAEAKNLRVLVELCEMLQAHTNDPAFISRWQKERSLIDEEEFKEVEEHILSCIAEKMPMIPLLRLMCLYSIVQGGLRQRQLDAFERELINVYGFSASFTFHNLRQSGLLASREGAGGGVGSLVGLGGAGNNWSTVRKGLELTVDQVDEFNPIDLHFVTMGCAPISARLVQHAVTKRWESIQDVLKALPGATIPHAKENTGGKRHRGKPDMDIDSMSQRTTVLVVFIGGVTHIEISALRFLSEKYPFDFMILATSIIDGGSLISSLIDQAHVDHAELMGEEELVKYAPGCGVVPKAFDYKAHLSMPEEKFAYESSRMTECDPPQMQAAPPAKGASTNPFGSFIGRRG